MEDARSRKDVCVEVISRRKVRAQGRRTGRQVTSGTAGQIEHGKTALINALTGRDTDRLEEEKRRGITIDLGFTWFELPDGGRAGIVDVPGHERFIHNMAAGVPGMDMVLLVIAADEGIMPQTREHIDILTLLGVEHFIIVLNKCDLADPEWQDMVEQEIREEMKGSVLQDAPLVRVSAADGQGSGALKQEIAEVAETLRGGDRGGRRGAGRGGRSPTRGWAGRSAWGGGRPLQRGRICSSRLTRTATGWASPCAMRAARMKC